MTIDLYEPEMDSFKEFTEKFSSFFKLVEKAMKHNKNQQVETKT